MLGCWVGEIRYAASGRAESDLSEFMAEKVFEFAASCPFGFDTLYKLGS